MCSIDHDVANGQDGWQYYRYSTILLLLQLHHSTEIGIKILYRLALEGYSWQRCSLRFIC